MADKNDEILALLKEIKTEMAAVKSMLITGGDITMKKDEDGNISYQLKPHLNDNGLNGEDEPHGV